MQRAFGDRVAMNSPIQGTAADIMKKAMLDVDKALKKYDVWKIVDNPENRKIACEDIPSLLENNNFAVKKILGFIDAILEKVEKKQFKVESINVKEIVDQISDNWRKDYAWIVIDTRIDDGLNFNISRDTFHTILLGNVKGSPYCFYSFEYPRLCKKLKSFALKNFVSKRSGLRSKVRLSASFLFHSSMFL